MKYLSILGSGWLGKALIENFESKGDHVTGSTTTPARLKDIQSLGAQAELIDLNPASYAAPSGAFLNAETLIINIPPAIRRGKGDEHFHQIKRLVTDIQEQATTLKKIIYISSTSVYTLPGDKKEEDADPDHILVKTENYLQENCKQNVLILRPAGLFGYGRIIVNHLIRKKRTLDDGPVNMVYRDDVVAIIDQLVSSHQTNNVWNVCADMHPKKSVFYPHIAEKSGLEKPDINTNVTTKGKTVNNNKIKKSLNYDFLYPDPMDFPV